ncbi:MAG: NUDIX hydrolase, partial [Deltaproteobacteria bacterium]|nr:NUDIX hydrolase [Deltaproteobacteria bacterium]
MEKKITTLGTLSTHSFTVALDEVRLRNGATGKRIKIDHPEAGAVVPFLSEKKILMVRQFRYALGRETLEIPAGKVDPGERPEDCIRRELREETGYEAGRIEYLYTYAPAIGYSNERIHLYCGYNLEQVERTIDEREITSVEPIGAEALEVLVREGRIQDGKTLLALFMSGFLRRP